MVLALARFGLPALLPATMLARNKFSGERARALFAGCAAHSVMPLDAPLSAAIGAGAGGLRRTLPAGRSWQVARQKLSDALAACLRELGGEIMDGAPREANSRNYPKPRSTCSIPARKRWPALLHGG